MRWSRPTGLSGWVTTPISSCAGERRSARNVGTPISPVPIKTIRIPRYGIKTCGATERRERRGAAARAITLSPAVTSR